MGTIIKEHHRNDMAPEPNECWLHNGEHNSSKSVAEAFNDQQQGMSYVRFSYNTCIAFDITVSF